MNKTIERAKEIIGIHIDNIRESKADAVKSIILVGSLSNNSYTGNVGSDIDLIHILRDTVAHHVREDIIAIIENTMTLTDCDIPISKNVYRYGDLYRPYPKDFELNLENKDLMELPIEILRIKDSGIIIYGENIIEEIDNPTREDIIQAKEFGRLWNKKMAEDSPEWYEEYLKTIDNISTRLLAQSVLTRAMLDYYFETEKSCSNKKEIPIKMKEEVSNYRFQEILDLSYKWRYFPKLLTQEEECFMHEEFKVWRTLRKGKEVDFVPLF